MVADAIFLLAKLLIGDENVVSLFDVNLDERRKQLMMTYKALARRSGVSLSTVRRVLAGDYGRSSFGAISRVAQALGLDVVFHSRESAPDVREQQARRKAERLVRMVQGNCALEAQAVDQSEFDDMVERTALELIDSKRALWAV